MKKSFAMLFILLMAVLAYSQEKQVEVKVIKEGPGRMEMRPHHRVHAMLELTEEQEKAFQKLALAQEKELLPIRSELEKLKGELRLLKAEDTPDLKAIEKKIDEIAQVKVRMQKIREKYFVERKKLLTPEQKEKLNLMIMKGDRDHLRSRKMHRNLD